MKLRWGRIAVATLLGELLPIGVLVAAVAVFGPRDPFGATFFAEALGRWIGPWGGAASAFLGALWVAWPLPAGAAVRHGVAVGLGLAAIDAIILLAARAPFEWLFVFSNLGKIFAGWLGGFVADRRGQAAASPISAKR